MESSISASTNGGSWELVPTNTAAAIALVILLIYLFFRHFLFVLMVMDIIIGWLRRFIWFPKEGKRRKTFIHWIIALGMFFGFLALAGSVGWLKFIPR